MATFENMILIENDSFFATAGVFIISNSLFVGSMGLCSHCVSIGMNSVLDQLPAFQSIIIGQIAEVDQQRQDIVPVSDRGNVVVKAAGIH